MFKRIFLVVIDSVGCGELEDSHLYGDFNVNTIKNISIAKKGLKMTNMQELGYGNVTQIVGVNENEAPRALISKMREKSRGKDTMTGHWELMGLEVLTPFKTFETFPIELIQQLERETNHKFIGNYAASGTEILVELGETHMKTKELILYTSADSVLQIAAHEEIIPLEELYRICQIARKITLEDKYQIGRVIARPFIGQDKTSFKRTANRHDYALNPFSKTVLDSLKSNKYEVISVGKINDIFNGCGITKHFGIKSNEDGMNRLVEIMKTDFKGLCFVNLVDFDALYGHRRDPIGYGNLLEEFDNQLKNVLNSLESDDLLIITADHGNDPTYKGTDHTREFVPLIAYNKCLKGKNLEIRESFADIGATIAENFNVEAPQIGKSFLNELK